jgi:hypothetical protein
VSIDLRAGGVPQSVVRGNIIWGNGSEQCAVAGTTGPTPVVSENLIQGGYAGDGNRSDDPRFIDDSITLAIKDRVFYASLCQTTIRVGDSLTGKDLRGRLINIGQQWSVIACSDMNQVTVWGEINDSGDKVFIPSTFRRTQ